MPKTLTLAALASILLGACAPQGEIGADGKTRYQRHRELHASIEASYGTPEMTEKLCLAHAEYKERFAGCSF